MLEGCNRAMDYVAIWRQSDIYRLNQTYANDATGSNAQRAHAVAGAAAAGQPGVTLSVTEAHADAASVLCGRVPYGPGRSIYYYISVVFCQVKIPVERKKVYCSRVYC